MIYILCSRQLSVSRYVQTLTETCESSKYFKREGPTEATDETQLRLQMRLTRRRDRRLQFFERAAADLINHIGRPRLFPLPSSSRSWVQEERQEEDGGFQDDRRDVAADRQGVDGVFAEHCFQKFSLLLSGWEISAPKLNADTTPPRLSTARKMKLMPKTSRRL